MIQTCQSDEKIVVEFEGSLDTAKCGEIEAELRGTVDDSNRAVEFDLAGVDFVSSSFLRLCIHAYKQVGADRFKIVNVAPMIKRVFMIAGLDAMVEEG